MTDGSAPQDSRSSDLETKATRTGHWIDGFGKGRLAEQSDPVIVSRPDGEA